MSMSRPRSRTGAEWVSAAHRDQVGTGSSQRRSGFEVDATRHLDQDPGSGVHSGGTLGDVGHRHVVEHDHGGLGRHGLVDLFGTVALHLDHPARPPTAGPGHRISDGHAGQVVVLHEDGIRESASMIVAAARPHGSFLEGAQARCGLSRVEHSSERVGPRHGVDIATGERGHTGQMAEEIECRAFGRNHRRQRSAHCRQHRARIEGRSVTAAP